MIHLLCAVSGAVAVAALHFATFFGHFFIVALIEGSGPNGKRYARGFETAVGVTYGWWEGKGVLAQVLLLTPLIALAAALPTYVGLRLLGPDLGGGDAFLFCFALDFALTRVTYVFFKP